MKKRKNLITKTDCVKLVAEIVIILALISVGLIYPAFGLKLAVCAAVIFIVVLFAGIGGI